MSDNLVEFQNMVMLSQLRNKSILDTISKVNEQASMLSRAVTKSATYCGCININAKKQIYRADMTLNENRLLQDTHILGSLCPLCKEKVEEEMGDLLFYLAATGIALDINIDEVIEKKLSALKTLGVYTLLWQITFL